MAYDSIFQPLTIGGVTIPNRIARAAHNVGLPWVDQSDDLIAYHEARAKGEVGLTILGIAGVHRVSPTSIPVMSDGVIDGYRRLADRMRPYGMKLFQQLWHSGPARFFPPEQPWSASDRPNPQVGVVPRPMTQTMIDEVVGGFASAARRVKEGGIDGIELHAAHGYLIGQFLSPATNHREDEYGGSPENRLRFLREVIAAIRAEVGDDFALGVRLSSDEQVEGGLTAQDTVAIAKAVEPTIDFLDLSFSGYYRFQQMFATMDSELGYELPASGIVTQAMSIPTIVTGRIMTLDDAERIVADGIADMVSMVRPLIADPELVKKAREGRSNEIRPCIGINQGCLGKFFTFGRMSCVVNPLVTQESTRTMDPTDRVADPQRVLVVGGGPAGLEAARTLALRGHVVELHEMNRSLGGQVAIASAAPYRADIGAITAWLETEVRRLGVVVRLNSPVDPDVIKDAHPDVVILATGSTPREDGFQAMRPAVDAPGITLPHVINPWQALGFGGGRREFSTALIYDDIGAYDAISVAEKLVEKGVQVVFASRHERIGATVDHTPSAVFAALERLFDSGLEFVPNATISEVLPGSVELSLMGIGRRVVPAEAVVLVGHNTPNRENADELLDAPFPVHVIGDATGSHTILDAIQQATLLARSI
ncbi:FAD-dependent oxidoreductase [Microbacterium sp. zg.B48]|uniref:oxidoreductase n=1 Tax=Microbacterium sp. zg.B48 TaxID=2969408 RepID=UPI00214C075C|nr:NAD(P)-binding protein [Microbacterium sp. zg.B48]MCR2764333.1 FAD-dependent oxidoreductase [Microbacterium sp. zg.B48]